MTFHTSVRTGLLLVVLAAAGTAVACQPPPPTCDGRAPTIVGTAGNDTINATPGPDVVVGLAGNDTLNGYGGNDVLCGGPGIDGLNGGDDDDVMEGGADRDVHDGGPGTDTVTYRSHPSAVVVALRNGSGPDLDVIDQVEIVVGSRHDDWLEGDDAGNVLHGLEGSDTLLGHGGVDRLVDSSTTLADSNVLGGGAGSDHLIGGAGRDLATYSAAFPGPVYANLGAGTVTGEGDDQLEAVDGVIGTGASDTLLGNAGNNVFEAGSGDDFIVGGGGDDELFGGPGTDMASWALVTTPVFVDLAHEYASGEGIDRVAGVENVTGGRSDDTLRGDAGPNLIDGYVGTDACTGGGGADTFLRCP